MWPPNKAAGGREPRKEEHGQHVPPRPAGQTAAVGGCGGKVPNLAQGRALKGISESFPILAASLRYLPLIRRLKLPTVFQELLAGRGGRPTTGLTSLPTWRCPVGGVASGLTKPRRRLSRTFARNRPPRCGCPIHASFVRSGPVSWDAYGRCGCGLSPVETLEPLACPLDPT